MDRPSRWYDLYSSETHGRRWELGNALIPCEVDRIHIVELGRVETKDGPSVSLGACENHPNECPVFVDWAKICGNKLPCIEHAK
jgi:hypothetical protein